jgi:hypothetical protein
MQIKTRFLQFKNNIHGKLAVNGFYLGQDAICGFILDFSYIHFMQDVRK